MKSRKFRSQKLLWFSIYGLFFYFTMSCVHFSEDFIPQPFNEPYEKVYEAQFEEVWKALQSVFKNYPLKTNDVEQGLLETRWIRKKMYWKPNDKVRKTSPTISSRKDVFRYQLKIRVVRDKDESEEKSLNTEVTILKTIHKKESFFSKEKSFPSDGIEEKLLLYRIKREIDISRKLDETFQNQSEES